MLAGCSVVICREMKECFLVAVENRSAETLLPITVERIAPHTIISHQWRAYNDIRNSNKNYVIHCENFVDPNTRAHTQSIKGMWCVGKRSFRKKSGQSIVKLGRVKPWNFPYKVVIRQLYIESCHQTTLYRNEELLKLICLGE